MIKGTFECLLEPRQGSLSISETANLLESLRQPLEFGEKKQERPGWKGIVDDEQDSGSIESN